MSSKKKCRQGVVISGAYGMGNAGDDAVLGAILSTLRSIDDQMPITVLARQPDETARRFSVRAIHPFRILRWLPIMGRTTLFISGGGSLLQDVTSRRNLWYYLFTIWAAKWRGCSVMLYGCGIGPIRSELGQRKTVKTLERCADIITLRDEDSLSRLRDWGMTMPLMCTADPAVSVDMADGPHKSCVGIVLRPWPGFSDCVPAFAGAAAYAYEHYGLRPVFFCLASGDETAARQVAEQLENIPWEMTDDWQQLGKMELVLSMRLHGLVFSLVGKTPAAGVSYDPKVSGFCEAAGYPWLGMEQVTKEHLRHLLDRAVSLDSRELSRRGEALRAQERLNGAFVRSLLKT